MIVVGGTGENSGLQLFSETAAIVVSRNGGDWGLQPFFKTTVIVVDGSKRG